MKSRYFTLIFCAGVALLFVFGRTAVEVINTSRPSDAPPLSFVARIGLVLAAMLVIASLIQMVVRFVDRRFAPRHSVSDPLCLNEMGELQEAQPATEQSLESAAQEPVRLPSRHTRNIHLCSGIEFWCSQAKRIDRAEHYQTSM